ncbi:T9SS type B sorting domain-containing protein [uncultured Algibacter sp.]|uniref:T9SS type B sorting domain-containing protein n=1 Tax=uncultured Algibacter sp. TaxID=298659 RepID=UPI002615982D|nr:T9SS type B sorting domain-containing protein [uncultured Algibacter sp.]
MIKLFKIVLIFIISSYTSFGQSGSALTCINAEPLCGSSAFTYRNVSGTFRLEQGPNYGCLGVSLNPSWFYLQIAKDGDIQLKIEQSTTQGGSPNLDVDFIIYGPFSDPRTPCTASLDASKIIDCSWATDFVEYIDIANTQAGEYYLLMITNFGRQPGYIKVTQTLGNATTNCVLVKDPIKIEAHGCEGDAINLDATTPLGVTYKWYEDDGSGTHTFTEIKNVTTNTYNTTDSNTFKVDVFDINHVLIEKYEFTTNFYTSPNIPLNIEDYTLCDDTDGDVDGITSFDLSYMDNMLLNGLDPNHFSVSYYSTLADAETENVINKLPLAYTNSKAYEEVIYARIENTTTNLVSCFDIGVFKLKVLLPAEIKLENQYMLCANTNGTETIITPPLIDTGLPASEYNFVWRLNNVVLNDDTDGFIFPEEDGNYAVEATHKITGCISYDNTSVELSSPPEILAKVKSFAFIEENSIEAEAIGLGIADFQFSIDDGIWQDSGLFSKVTFGDHLIKARDKNGCGYSEVLVTVIDYPQYFTPNGDGIHDYWNIIGVANQPYAEIRIFNRYGKLIKQLNPNSKGWDGTFNGTPLPSEDYWFTITYIEPRDNSTRTFKAHFTLKR